MRLPSSQLDLVQSSGSSRLGVFPRKGGGGGGHGSSGGGRGSSSSGKSGSSTSSSSKAGSVSVPYSGKVSASSASRGGGVPAVIPSGSPFTGRLYGGATRDQIYGTSRIGSGYPYGSYGTFYGGRPFPYGFYPLYITAGYYGGDEYGHSANATRPGGVISTAVVQPSGNASSSDSFYLIGDESSVTLVLSSLVSQCGIANTSVTPTFLNSTLLDSSNSTQLVPHPEQIVQYYRASSFALALFSYNNSATLPANAPMSNTSAMPPVSADTPFPAGLNLTLLACLNSTIAATLPLLDSTDQKHHLTTEEITWIVLASLTGLFVIVLLWSCCSWRCIRQRSQK